MAILIVGILWLLILSANAASVWPFNSEAEAFEGSTSTITSTGNDQYVYAQYIVPTPKKDPLPWYITNPVPEFRTGLVYVPGDENPRFGGQCVLWLRYVTKAQYTGDAGLWSQYIDRSITVPKVGDIVVFNFGNWGHLGVVIAVDEETGMITVRSRNGIGGLYMVTDDKYSLDDVDIVGYFRLP